MSLESITLENVAANINSQVKIITEYMRGNGLSVPTLAANASRDIETTTELQEARFALLDAANQLEKLALGPLDSVTWNVLTRKHDDMALKVINHFDIFYAVPSEGDISYEELSKKTKFPEDKLRRILRHAMTSYIFYEPRPGYVAHTASTKALFDAPNYKSWIGHGLEDVPIGIEKMIESLEKHGDSQDPAYSATGIAVNLQKGENAFKWLENDGEGEKKGWRQRRFGEAMKVFTTDSTFNPIRALDAFDWESLKDGTVVDVGGSIGHTSIMLAEKHPQLHFVVQDFAGLEAQFKETCPPALQSRVTFQSHDFFTPQPVKGASAYFLKHVLHDWPNDLAVKILQNIVPAMAPESRIIIVEVVIPEPGTAAQSLEKLTTSMDLQMLTFINARERTKQDWIDLVAKAGNNLVVKSIISAPGSVPNVIELAFE